MQLGGIIRFVPKPYGMVQPQMLLGVALSLFFARNPGIVG